MQDTTTYRAAETRLRGYLEEESRRAGFTLVSAPQADEQLCWTVALRSPQGRILKTTGRLGDILNAMDRVAREEQE